jgi:Mg-chelatase subunit ChlD
VTGSIGFDRPELLWLFAALPALWAASLGSRRKLARSRRLLAIAARTSLWSAIVLAVSGITWRRAVDDLAVVFVLDRSASVGPAGRDAAVAWVREALQNQRDHDLAGVVAVGGDALVEAEPREQLDLAGVESDPDPNQSDLGAGIRLATALLPADRTRRIVVLTDGEQTRGDAARQALSAAGDDLSIAVVPVGTERRPEVLVDDLVVPPRVDQGAAYDVKVVARAEQDTDAKLRLWRNDAYLGELAVQLVGGRATVIPVPPQGGEPGLYRYRAALEVPDPAADGFSENNQAVATVQVAGRPRLAVVEGSRGEGDHLATAMRGAGLDVDLLSAADLPAGLEGIREYAAVILVNVPAYELTVRQQQALASSVRDLGHGLAMVGGDHAFGLGGYHQTPIEEVLPVEMDLTDKSRFPKLAMVLVIDKSGSMGGGQGSKLALAEEAATLTADLLNPRDELGVVAFDDAATWVVPLQALSDKPAVETLIQSIRPGGGTDLYPALDAAFTALDASDAALLGPPRAVRDADRQQARAEPRYGEGRGRA